MKRFLVAAVVTLSLMWTLSTRAGATVTWDFFETGLVFCGLPIPTGCSLTPLPIMSITLSSDTETGSAFWSGPFSSSPPVVPDPNFAFTLGTPGSPAITTIEPPSFTGVDGFYNITWNAAGGGIGVNATLQPFTDASPAVSTQAFYQVSGITGCFGGLAFAGNACLVSGIWVEVPEPSSLLILAMALIGLLGIGYLRNRRPQPRT